MDRIFCISVVTIVVAILTYGVLLDRNEIKRIELNRYHVNADILHHWQASQTNIRFVVRVGTNVVGQCGPNEDGIMVWEGK